MLSVICYGGAWTALLGCRPESDNEVEDTLDATEAARPGGGAECTRSVEEPLPPDSMTTDGTVTIS
ncbi:hypothetical protein PG994_009816 [Apiospora phragmitis]|uniref:Secreted protein n=1 Tax=Apiospora phragmitis TaxID=2905665 RepID=A0ABR1U795_9PEZI